MQRSITDKRVINTLVGVVLFLAYSSLATIYPFLPPLFAVLFVLFLNALEHNDPLSLFSVIFMLLVYEANNHYLVFSTVVYFYLIYKLVMPKIYTNFSCVQCIRFFYPLLAYLGYFLFMSLVANIFLLPLPHINYYIIYYIVIEFFIVSVV